MTKTTNFNRQIKEGLPFFRKPPVDPPRPDRWCDGCGARLRRSRQLHERFCSPCEERRAPSPEELHPVPEVGQVTCKVCGGAPVAARTGIYANHCYRCRDDARERAGVGRRRTA